MGPTTRATNKPPTKTAESSKAAKSSIGEDDLIDGTEDESGLATDDGGMTADEDEIHDDMNMDQEGNESEADSSNVPDQQNSDDEGNSDDETPANKDTQRKTWRTVLGPLTPGKKSILPPQVDKKTELLSKVAKAQERLREVSQDRRVSPNDKFLSDLANMEMQEYQGLVEEATRLGYIKKPTPSKQITIATSGVPGTTRKVKIDWKELPTWDKTWSTKDDLEFFLNLMEAFKDDCTEDNTVPLPLVSAKKIWNYSIKSLGGRVKTLSNTLMKQESWDAMVRCFKAWFLKADPNASFDLLTVTWEQGAPVNRFVQVFREAVSATEMPADDKSVRRLVAQLFLVHFPDTWMFGSLMEKHEQAPPLETLYAKAVELAKNHPNFVGAGRHLRPIPNLASILAQDLRVSPSPVATVVRTENRPQAVGGFAPRTFTKKREREESTPAASERVTKSSGLCFSCHKPGHMQRDCPDNRQRKIPRTGENSATSSNATKIGGKLPRTVRVLKTRPKRPAKVKRLVTCTDQFVFDCGKQTDDQEREVDGLRVPRSNKDNSDAGSYFLTNPGFTLSGNVKRVVRFISNVDSHECVSLPMTVDGERITAVIDTGANITCISPRLTKALKLMIIPAERNDRPIQLAHKGLTVKRVGSTVPVSLSTLKKTVLHPCEVLDMPEGYDLLVGMDTFYRFGFGISGLPGLHRGAEHAVTHPIEDERSALAPLVTPEIEETPEYIYLKDSFLKHMRPLLDENKAIPKDSFCTIPESKVYLRTPPGVAAWKREYPFSHYHEKIVHDAILEWLQNGTIFKLPKRSAFNIPLILVGKKDLKGNKTGFRPCLDPLLRGTTCLVI